MVPEINLLLPSPEACSALTEQETSAVIASLKNPAVQKYIRHLQWNCLLDIAGNDVDTKEGQDKLINRYLKLQGIQHICATLLAAGRTDAPKAAK